jgi:hypothetical protein
MARAKRRAHISEAGELELFTQLKSFADKVGQGEMRKGNMFSLCIRASFAKCYEFNLHAWNEKNAEASFFWLPTLRGICEDLIVLNYMQGIPRVQRESLVQLIMQRELQARLKIQKEFFENARPHQPVLGPGIVPDELNSMEQAIRAIWQANGWPNMSKGTLPPTRQMAEKHGGDVLATLYDFLFRLTSGTVHFTVNALLRNGWGTIPLTHFSVFHFSGYYKMFGRIYGAFMFCCYFELFGRFIRTDNEVKAIVQKIRQKILSIPRWPEITTFEEMNLQPPKINPFLEVILAVHTSKETQLLRKRRPSNKRTKQPKP